MKTEDFWEKAKQILNDWVDGDSDSCGFFVGEMDELFEDWNENKETD